MNKNDWTIAFLLVVITVLSLALIDTRLSIQNNVKTVQVQVDKEKIVFVGDSITDQYNLNNYYNYNNKIIVNSGISGYKTKNIIDRFNNLVEQHQADKLFLMIGTNDLSAGIKEDEIISNTVEIISMIKKSSPKTKIYYETIYPVNGEIRKNNLKTKKNDKINYINEEMKKYCDENDVIYLDVHSILVDDNGNLDSKYTEDGLHVNETAYEIITEYLKPYVEE